MNNFPGLTRSQMQSALNSLTDVLASEQAVSLMDDETIEEFREVSKQLMEELSSN